MIENDILNAFTWLSNLLYNNFNRQNIVLLDENDSYCNSILFKNIDVTETDDIISYLGDISSTLHKSNPYLRSALLTGVLPIKDVGVSPPGNNFGDYRFLDNHEFSQYYGFTKNEVEKIVERNVNKQQRKKTRKILKEWYDGYLIKKQNIKLYSIWSVVDFFTNKMEPKNYWVCTQYMENIVQTGAVDLVT